MWTRDNISGINDVTSTASEWITGPTATFISSSSFSLVGDQTNTFTVGRRLKIVDSQGTLYGTVTASTFTTLTTLIVAMDSGTVDSGLSSVSYGILAANNPSVPSTKFDQPTYTVASATTTDFNAVGSRSLIVSGTTTITAITLTNGQERFVEFSGALTLTNGASLILPGSANITTTAGDTAIFRGETAGVVRCMAYQKVNGGYVVGSQLTNSISSDVLLNNTSNYFTGPTIAQGTVGTWLATGTVTVSDLGGGTVPGVVRLWDGTTVMASSFNTIPAVGYMGCAISGFISSPAGNIRIDVKDASSSSGKILANQSGLAKDSTLTVIRIA